MNLLVVESAAKARTLQTYLGNGWKVLATGGHVETLPDDRATHGKDARKAYWPNRPGELPSPPWVWTERGEAAVRAILDEAGPDPTFWIATDPDREGEFIAWCLDRILGAHGPTHRVTFHEVTEEAVRAALERPRPVDARMVDSALIRKFLDRLVGFRTSSMANALVPGKGASMGRVQTPTLGFVVERELEREAHEPIPYFEVHALAHEVDLRVRFHERDDPAAWRNEAGQVDPSRTFRRELAEAAVASLGASGRVRLTAVKPRTRERKPEPPLSTDALLQIAGSRFGWSPRKTSALASMLYEAGHVTYIRTDSTRLALSAVQRARAVVAEAFGEDHLGPEARANVATGPTQDAHEAIRPTRFELDDVAIDDADARRLYRLVRAHTLASQMAPSLRSSLGIEAVCSPPAPEAADPATPLLRRPLTGSVSWRTFDGWEAAYREFLGDTATAAPAIPLVEGAEWTLDAATEERANPLLVEDETRPPPRYRPHTLIKAMKDAGIGRPSTYARTVEKLEERAFMEVQDGALAPTERGRTVWTRAAPLYAREATVDHAGVELFSPEYTALMEERLDRIEEGEIEAPTTWEAWRDQIRDLHEAARERRNAGRSTLRQQAMLTRLLANAPSGLPGLPDASRLESLSYEDAQELVHRLRECGVSPAATEAQMEHARRLVAELELDEGELHERTGLSSLDDIRDSAQASAAIEVLQRLYHERRPPSTRQRRFVQSLVKESGLSEAEAAALVGAGSLEELTGGSEGTASALIDALKQRVEAGG
jgi:DNA topoisomerase-1